MLDDSISIRILNNEVSLDMKCWNCLGTGKPKDNPDVYTLENGDCSLCNGTGYQLTGVGEEIIRLVKRHVK